MGKHFLTMESLTDSMSIGASAGPNESLLAAVTAILVMLPTLRGRVVLLTFFPKISYTSCTVVRDTISESIMTTLSLMFCATLCSIAGVTVAEETCAKVGFFFEFIASCRFGQS